MVVDNLDLIGLSIDPLTLVQHSIATFGMVSNYESLITSCLSTCQSLLGVSLIW